MPTIVNFQYLLYNEAYKYCSNSQNIIAMTIMTILIIITIRIVGISILIENKVRIINWSSQKSYFFLRKKKQLILYYITNTFETMVSPMFGPSLSGNYR